MTQQIVTKDVDNNQIISIFDNQKGTIKIFLKLNNAKARRYLGFIDMNNRKFHVERIRSRHWHYKMNGYGFIYNLVKNAKKFDFIELVDEHSTYLIPRNDLLEKGKFLHFKEQGFELQIFLEREHLDNYKVASPY